MSSARLARWGGVAAIIAGLLWLVLRPLIEFSRNDRLLGRTYEDYNRLVPVPLLLFLVGLVGLHACYARTAGPLGIGGLVVAAIGVTAAAVGAVVEFWWAGGIRQGDKAGSDAGWMFFGLGYFGLLLGLMLFGIASQRSNALGRWSAVPLVMGALGPAWPFVSDWAWPSVFVQSLLGLGWVILGYALWSDGREGPVASLEEPTQPA